VDCRGTKLLGLFVCGSLVATASAVAGEKPFLRAMAWLSPEGQFEALSSEPVVVFSTTGNHAGEVLFHTPTLLGGQAAKAGISCASCHVNGRSNPHFQFPGVSGAPGTADVTHSFFSSHRGDGQFNPIPIPDLSQAGKVSHNPENRDLEKFIRGLIVEEFNGAEPRRNTLDALAAYVRALRSDSSGSKVQPITVATHLRRIQLALTAASKHESREPELTRLLLSGARHQLGLIHERFVGKRLSKERTALRKLSANFVNLQNAIGVRSDLYYQLSQTIGRDFQSLREMLTKTERRSLYNQDLLAAALREKNRAP